MWAYVENVIAAALQEQKRLLGLSAPGGPKKKKRKKVHDVNAPPPDTAQHAIYVSMCYVDATRIALISFPNVRFSLRRN